MRPAAEILAELKRRDLLELATRTAAEHHLSVEALCSRSRTADVVRARHELWESLRNVLSSNAAVARIWGVDHCSIDWALREPTTIVEVVLAIWPDEKFREYVLRWRRRGGQCFGVTDCARGETTWFATYGEARRRFDRECSGAGAPSFQAAAAEVSP